MPKTFKQNASWLLDGFPRTSTQAAVLDKTLSAHDAALNLLVRLDVPEEVILDRIENRWVHIPSGRVYNLTFNPPKVPGKDDITGDSLSKRPDDNPETFKENRRISRTHPSSLGTLQQIWNCQDRQRRNLRYHLSPDQRSST